jgi:hypothetical protein
MKALLSRCFVASLQRFHDSAKQRCNGFVIRHGLILCALFSSLPARAQFAQTDQNTARSISGQFIASGPSQFSRLADLPRVAADTNFVRLEPALLAISAERIKDSLYRRLEIKTDTPWRGQIYLVVHPAQSLNENVTIVSRLSANGCSYQVELPDVLSHRSFTRAMTGVILLEFANRNAQSHSAEMPAWLTDGLSEEMLAAGSPEIILSMPNKLVNGLPVTQISATERGMDPLAQARRVLETFPPLTFEQLTWPTDAQLDGNDGGAYRASAQVFVGELLKLKNGPLHLRAMLESLPRFYNWQTAFQSAFREVFPRPLDLEKWWALQLVGFAAHDRGPGWTLAVSRARLDEILSVPVEMRTTSNSLPARAEISLQAVIRNLESARQNAILQTKLRDLGLAQLRMSPPLAALTDAYRGALAGYLAELPASTPVPATPKPAIAAPQKTSIAKMLKKLDALDALRRTIESTIKPDVSMQPGLAPLKF